MPRIRFYLDPDTGHPHCEQHGVSAEEAADAFNFAAEDAPARDGARQCVGRTRGGAVVRVIYVPEAGAGAFIITAYPLSGKALAAFRRRQRRRGRR